MSKRNREKRSKHGHAAFPFRLLQHWIKHFESGLPCRCGKEAHYSMQSFFDLERWQRLTTIGYSEAEALASVWDEALAGQLKGEYNVGHVHNVCQRCTFDVIATAVGDDVAQLAMLPMMLLGDVSSVIVGAELASRDDDGRNYVGVVRARTLEDLLKHMAGETMSLDLAKAAG